MKRKSAKTKGKKAKKNNPMDVIDLSSPIDDLNDGTPLRPVLCLKRKENMREFEEREECFILDFEPDDNVSNQAFDDADISIIAEKGQVACRDYPHPRHLCVKNPFEKTPNNSYCELCFCYVCETAAPCCSWEGESGHCHAIDGGNWKFLRSLHASKK